METELNHATLVGTCSLESSGNICGHSIPKTYPQSESMNQVRYIRMIYTHNAIACNVVLVL